MSEAHWVQNPTSDPSSSQRFAPSFQKDQGKHPRLSLASVFAVTSGKGGVGKTNVVANLAAALTLRKKRVMVIDADLGMPNLDLFLGVKPDYTLADFFAGKVSLNEIIAINSHGILLLPGASGAQEITFLRDEQKVALLTEMDTLTHEMDFVLVDTGSGISDSVTYFATGAQEIIVVATPDPSSITDAYGLIKVLTAAHRQKRFCILANNVADEHEARLVFDTLSRTTLRLLNASLDYLGWVPRDPALIQADSRSQIVVFDAAGSASAKAFMSLADKLVQSSAAVQVKGNPQFFFRRLLEARRGV